MFRDIWHGYPLGYPEVSVKLASGFITYDNIHIRLHLYIYIYKYNYIIDVYMCVCIYIYINIRCISHVQFRYSMVVYGYFYVLFHLVNPSGNQHGNGNSLKILANYHKTANKIKPIWCSFPHSAAFRMRWL